MSVPRSFVPVLPGSALADPCWSFAHGRFNSFRCRVELSAVTRLEHEVDCACGSRRIDILQPCPVGSPPPTGPGGARRSHDHRTDQRHRVKSFRSTPRCRSPQHARRREVPSRSTKPTTSATSDPIAELGMSRRAGLHLADDRTDLGAGPNRLTRSRAPGLMPMPSARMRPAALSPSWCTAATGTPERDDDDSDGDLHGSRRHAALRDPLIFSYEQIEQNPPFHIRNVGKVRTLN